VHDEMIGALAGIGTLGILCQWIAWRVNLPAILFLLITGIAVGPVTGWIRPDDLFGDMLFPMVSLAVAVILFEGALTLKKEEIRGHGRVVTNLITLGAMISWAVTAVSTHVLLKISWELSCLFGALMVVTGPTVIMPMIRAVRPNPAIANVLRWEGILIDPLGAILALLTYEFLLSRSGGGTDPEALAILLKGVAVGGLLGAVGGFCHSVILRRHILPDYLHNVATIASVIGVFTVANLLQEESGLLAVTVMGVWMANTKGLQLDDIADFMESLSVFFISGLFIILAARIDMDQLVSLGYGALVMVLSIQFLARPLNVAVSSLGSTLTWRERILVSWIGPRGIVAAAVSALFALRLQEQGVPDAGLLVPLSFLVVIGTVFLQSLTARPLARALRVIETERNGFLVVGANILARAVAKALHLEGIRVLLVSSEWDDVAQARLEGLPTVYGNPVSEYLSRNIDLEGIGGLLCLAARNDLNVLSAFHFEREFGREHIYLLSPPHTRDGVKKADIPMIDRWSTLFGEGVTYGKLYGLILSGWRIRATKLTEIYDMETFRKASPEAVPLFAVDPAGRVEAFTLAGGPKTGPGWKILSLAPERDNERSAG